MKLGKPTGKDFGNAATLAGGAFIGIGLAKGAFSLVHDEDKVLATEDEKSKHNWIGAAKHGGIAIVTLGAASAIKSADTLSMIAKGLLYGMSAQSASAGFTLLAEKVDTIKTLASSTDTVKKAAAKALGLKGCGCGDHSGMNGARRGRSRRGMRGIGVFTPNVPEFAVIEQSANSFDSALAQGKMLSA